MDVRALWAEGHVVVPFLQGEDEEALVLVSLGPGCRVGPGGGLTCDTAAVFFHEGQLSVLAKVVDGADAILSTEKFVELIVDSSRVDGWEWVHVRILACP